MPKRTEGADTAEDSTDCAKDKHKTLRAALTLVGIVRLLRLALVGAGLEQRLDLGAGGPVEAGRRKVLVFVL